MARRRLFFDRARELSAGVGGSVDRLALLYGTWLGAVTTESFEASSKASAALLAEATQARNAATIAVAHRAIGATLLYGGLFDEAKRQCDQATSLLGSTDDADLARRFNGSPRAAAQILRAFAAWATSDFNLAARDAQEAAAGAERADAMTRGYVLGWAAILGAGRKLSCRIREGQVGREAQGGQGPQACRFARPQMRGA